MRAIRLHEYGPAENLRAENVPDPVPSAGQVRVRVNVSGLHLLETWLRQGRPVGPHSAPELPTVLGGEVAGVVDAVGEGVPTDWIGRRVAAGIDGGGYAELAVAGLHQVYELPDALGEPEAIAMMSTGVTALAVWELADVKPGEVVLVTAAAGGIGGLLVRLAKAAGATVVGLAGGEAKTRLVLESGADHAVDYKEPGWPERVRAAGEVSVALDGVGGDVATHAWALAGRGVSFGAAAESGAIGGELPDGVRSLFTSPVMAELADPESMRGHVTRALDAAAAGTVVPAYTAYKLEEAAEAHRALEGRETVGKVVLEV